MPVLLQDTITKKSPTSSFSDEDLFVGLSECTKPILPEQFQLPDCNITNGMEYSSDKTGTASYGEPKQYRTLEIIEEIESPLIPPNKKFQVKLIIKNIRKGKPSVCDEIEL